MRISTSQIYDTGIIGMQRNQSALLKLQNEISSNTRILTPSDDPVAASEALVVAQSQSVEEQYQTNQKTATSQLSLVDVQLNSLTNTLQTIRDSVVKGGNGSMTNTDRQSIANDIESSLSELMGIANTDNGTGDYLFSGYQGGTLPFAADATKTALPPATALPIKYSGDQGARLVQVSSSRQMAVTVPGSDVFMSGKNGNGTFVAATGGSVDTTAGSHVLDASGNPINNQGTATISPGSVVDQQKWALAINNPAAGQPLEIRFYADPAGTGKIQYGIYDPVSTNPPVLKDFTSGQAISLVTSDGVDFGAQVVIQGTPQVTAGPPATGDTFTIKPSTSQSLFQTAQNLIAILRSPAGSTTYSTTQLTNDLAGQLSSLDQGMLQVSNVQSAVGTNERELVALGSASTDLVIQYKSTLSGLQDLDWNKTLSDYTMQQVSLEAAQKSFVQISGLSLFKYI